MPDGFVPTVAHVLAARRELAKRHLLDFAGQIVPGYERAGHHARIADHLEAVERGDIDRLMICMPPRHGKALALDTPVPTPSGWTTMGAIKPGDMVFSETGEPCRVVAKSDVYRDRPVYRVETDDGDVIVADAEHEWLVRLCRKRPVFKIKTTRQLAERSSNRAPMIAAVKPLQLADAELPVDPYVLGVWLGDGSTNSAAIVSADQEMIDEVSRIEGGHNVYASSSRGAAVSFRAGPHYRHAGVRASDTLQARLRALGVLGNKHIPMIYKRASEAQRLACLQGLIDTDGYVAADGQIEFCGINRQLAEDVQELVASLGGKASLIEGRATLEGRDCGPKYRVMFYMADAARLSRKAKKCKTGKRAHRRYVMVTPAGFADTVCIEVDSPSHLFLCGRSMLPTHNSQLASRLFPAWCMGRNPRTQIIAASYNSDLAMDFGRDVRNIVGSPEFADVFPGVSLAVDSKAANRMNTNKGGAYIAAGVGTAVTGRGARIALIDDPFKDREEADSQRNREKVWAWYQSTLYTRLMPGGAVVVVNTRWHEDDLSGRLLNGADKWELLELPAIDAAGDALWPEWYPVPALERIKANIGPREWSALYQQRPQPDEGTFFQRDWLTNWETMPKALNIYGTSDYAVTDGGGDFTVHRVWGVDAEENIYRLDGWSGQTSADEWIERKCDLVAKWKPLAWFGEAGVIQKAIEPMLLRRMRERKVFCRLEFLSSISDKPTRARGFQARAAMGKVFFEPGADVSEFLMFPAGKHDDEVDVAGMMGRALDMVHPAIVKTVAAQGRPNDRWGRLAQQARPSSTGAFQ